MRHPTSGGTWPVEWGGVPFPPTRGDFSSGWLKLLQDQAPHIPMWPSSEVPLPQCSDPASHAKLAAGAAAAAAAAGGPVEGGGQAGGGLLLSPMCQAEPGSPQDYTERLAVMPGEGGMGRCVVSWV